LLAPDAICYEGAQTARAAVTDDERKNGEGKARKRGIHGWMIAAALFALAGAVASGIAWRTHWEVRSSAPTFRPACSISETVDCAKAARSTYAVVLRVPIALWSALGFGLLLVLSLIALPRRPDPPFGLGLLFLAGAFAALVSVAMALIARLALGVLCPECTAIQVFAVATFVCIVLQLRELRLGPARALVADLRWVREHGMVAAAVATVGGAAVAALIGLYPTHRWTEPPTLPGLAGNIANSPLGGPGDLRTGVTPEGHPFIGAERPWITVLEFSDYECPVCRHGHAALRDVVRRNRDRIRLVHAQFPLDDACNPAIPRPFHRSACRLAAAASCAGVQGRFWEANDVLFNLQGGRDAPDVADVARRSGVPDLAAFLACVDGPQGSSSVRKDVEAGVLALRDAGFAPGTPLFELRDASGRMLGRYLGFGGKQGMPENVLRRLDAGWPEEPGDADPRDGR
jgi:protein-disulfide isomerase/uncharacterized membrane protein